MKHCVRERRDGPLPVVFLLIWAAVARAPSLAL